MNEVRLRLGQTPEDRSRVEAITRSSGFFSEVEVQVALEVFDDCMSDPESGYRYLFAETSEGVVGYACWGRDEQTESSYELYWIAVDGNHRSEGIGKRLLQAVEREIADSGHGQLYIETAGREQYLPTRKFYEHQGYNQAAFLADYFAPGDARVIYAKRV